MIKLLALASYLAILGQPKVQAPDKVEFKRKTVLDYSELEISGEVVRPAATLIQGRGKTKFRPLIIYRGDFRPELVRSLDAL